MKSKVILVGAFPGAGSKIIGGTVTSCMALVDSTFSDEFDVLLIDSTQISNPPPRLLMRALYALRRFVRYLKALYQFRPPVVILFSTVGSSHLEKTVMALVARLFSVSTLLFLRGGALVDRCENSKIYLAYVRLTMIGVDYVLCQGEKTKHFAVDRLGYRLSNAPVIMNWTATRQLLSIGENRSMVYASTINIVFLGWVEISKGIFELLEACRVIKCSKQFKLIVAGRGHAEAAARERVAAYGLQDRVEFAGWVLDAEKEALLRCADILVLPSWAEGFPNAIIEAMAAKVAVVVTAVGNVPDLIHDGQEAMLVPPKDVEALRCAIELLLEDSAFRWKVAEQGHAFACENFSVDKGVARLTEVIQSAIQEKNNNKCVA